MCQRVLNGGDGAVLTVDAAPLAPFALERYVEVPRVLNVPRELEVLVLPVLRVLMVQRRPPREGASLALLAPLALALLAPLAPLAPLALERYRLLPPL